MRMANTESSVGKELGGVAFFEGGVSLGWVLSFHKTHSFPTSSLCLTVMVCHACLPTGMLPIITAMDLPSETM